ncbi:hypothetical protein PsorP6_016550 [Peronosclerospora sorghi]|uniref:Uncharacterized protein n=1 Tax=Peronosclerospora sorghi TaxID=230839 RepID=A0ACC0VN61_9STRA|nr:hypothetical protein PsorP6_016550 [Peronosclerospora sorghi]
MLDCAELVEPTLPAVWEDVAAEYNSKRADGMLEKTSRALNAHFARLARHKKPTGNPDCPQAVQQAKSLRRYLLAKEEAQSVSNDADLELGIETEEGDAEDNEDDGEEESEVDEMLDADSGNNDGEAEVSYSESSNSGGGGCVEGVEGVYGHSPYHNIITKVRTDNDQVDEMELVARGVRRTADPPASADAVRVADYERLIEDPGMPGLPALPVQVGCNVSRNSGRPSRKGTPQPKSVTTTTPAAPRQGGLTSTTTLKNYATFTSNSARTRNRIGIAAEETTASAKQLGTVAVGMVTSQEERWVTEMNERRLIREEAARREDRRRKEERKKERLRRRDERRERRAERHEDRRESQSHEAMMMSMMTIMASAQGLSIPSGEMAKRKRNKSKRTKDQSEGVGESSTKDV